MGFTPRWAYAITTVEMRRGSLLPATIDSLARAGFKAPRLAVDGSKDLKGYETRFGLETTLRTTPLRAYAHWFLTLSELYFRDPAATYFAMFQDDLLAVSGLKTYLERSAPEVFAAKGYLNLYTFPVNQAIGDGTKPGGGWFKANQMGKGAVALVFDKPAVLTLLSSRHMVERAQDVHRGHRSIDGGVLTAMAAEGWTEYCHNPSLVQHTGDVSAIGNVAHAKADSFRGENYDPNVLLG